MSNKPIDYKFWEEIGNEMYSLSHLEGPCCSLTAHGNSKDKEYLRVWSSISQIANIVEISLSYEGEEEFGPIDDHELTKLNGITKLRSLSISNMPVTGSVFVTLKNLIHLQTISVRIAKQFDNFFDWVQNFPELVTVSLDKSPIIKPNLKNLINNPKLREISFRDCGLTDTSIESFPCLPNLYDLSLAFGNLTGESLSFIAECPLLVNLTLTRNKLTRKGIATIVKSMKKKEFVDLYISGNEGVDDSCLEEIASMTNLSELYITNTSITDKGFMQLCDIQFLRCINVRGTEVSEKAAQELHEKLPYCYILYSGNNKKDEEIAPKQDGYNEYFGRPIE
jgi:hypothetical protein